MNNIPKYTLWAEVDEDLLEIEGLLAGMGNLAEMAELTAMSEMAEASFAIEGLEPDEGAESVYRLLPELDPFSVDDIKKAHRLMMGNQLEGAGTFRREEAGIFDGEEMIYRAGDYEEIPHRLEDLLSWTREAKEHPLIKSCVFHYEFEAIHPFADGNGRMGRLWQTLFLGHWNPVFFRIPVDPIIQHHQEGYYGSLLESDQLGDCGPLVQFLCGAILEALEGRDEPRKKVRKIQRHTRLLECDSSQQ
jgi:Fic family protein